MAWHAQPFGAIAELPIVMVSVHVPAVPDTNDPAVAPPVNEVSEHPLFDVKVWDAEISAEADIPPVVVTVVKLAVVPVRPPLSVPPARGRKVLFA